MLIDIEASLLNPDDPAETTLVADVATVGTTRRLATGQILSWDAASLERFAPTLIGQPINVSLNDAGLPTSHSRKVVGSITKSVFDPTTQAVRIFGSLWKHYYPSTVERLGEIFPEGKVQSSIEFIASKVQEHEDGSITPLEGRFSGLGLVGTGADTGQRVLLMASIAEDEGRSTEVKVTDPVIINNPTTTTTFPVVGSFEWIGNHAAEYLANLGTTENPVSTTVVATFGNSVVYSDANSNTFRLDFEREADKLVFGEPVKVEPTFVPLEASREDAEDSNKSGVMTMADDKEFAELKASYTELETKLADATKKNTDYEAAEKQREADAAAEMRASERIGEIEKITPYTDDAVKAEHKAIFKTADDQTYEQFKKLMLASVETAGGVASEGNVAVTTGDDVFEAEALKNLPQWKEELLASYKNDAILGAKK